MALKTYLTGIADAIREKKGTTDPINAQDFASEISSISTGGGGENPLQTLVSGKGTAGGKYLCQNYQGTNVDFLNGIDLSAINDMTSMFNGCINLTAIPQFDTSNVTTMKGMFQGCTNLTTMPLLNTSNVTDMASMFSGCYTLTTIPSLDTGNVTSMSYMFNSCDHLTTIRLLDTSNVTNMQYMFFYCEALTTIDITKLANNARSFANGCYILTKLIIRSMDTIPTFGADMFGDCYHFTGEQEYTYNPEGLQDGRIYVPDDQVDALKAKTG